MMEVSWSQAIRRMYPIPVVLVVSCNSEGKPDVMPAGRSMVTSGRPPTLAVNVGHTRYTHRLIEETGEFVVVFSSEEMKGLVECTGSCSGRDVDKFAEYGIETAPARLVKTPLVKNAVACFECEVSGKLGTGDHTIFAGEVVASCISDKYRDRLYNFGPPPNRRFRTIPEK